MGGLVPRFVFDAASEKCSGCCTFPGQTDSTGGTADSADILPQLPEDLRRAVLLVTMGKTIENLKFFMVSVGRRQEGRPRNSLAVHCSADRVR